MFMASANRHNAEGRTHNGTAHAATTAHLGGGMRKVRSDSLIAADKRSSSIWRSLLHPKLLTSER
jgi:hypothetical protein